MASHRRPKQPSRTRVTVLTATAAAAVALTSQAAHADPKPTKAEVKAQVDKLYDEAEVATEKYDGAKEQQGKPPEGGRRPPGQGRPRPGRAQHTARRPRFVASAQYRSAASTRRSSSSSRRTRTSYLDKASTLDQVSAKQADALQQIQLKQRSLAQEREEAQGQDQGSLGDPQGARREQGEGPGQARRRRRSFSTRSPPPSVPRSLGRRAVAPAPNLGSARTGFAAGRRRARRRQERTRQAVRLRRHRPRLLRLLRADVVGLRPGGCLHTPHLGGAGQRGTAPVDEPAQAGRPGHLLRRRPPRGPVRGQRHGAARAASPVRWSATRRSSDMPFQFGVRIA